MARARALKAVESKAPRRRISKTDQERESLLADYVAQIPEAFLICRDISHHWMDHWVKRERDRDNLYTRALVCERCETVRVESLLKMEANGRVWLRRIDRPRYRYPTGYRGKVKIGRVQSDVKEMIRYRHISRLIEV